MIPHRDQDVLEALPFQLYTPSVVSSAYLLQAACKWPADIREFAASPRSKLIFRVTRRIEPIIIPIQYSSLLSIVEDLDCPFVVVLSNNATKDDVSALVQKMDGKVLHISEDPEHGLESFNRITPVELHAHAKEALRRYRERNPEYSEFCDRASSILNDGVSWKTTKAICPAFNHGLTAPNEFALQAFGYRGGQDRTLNNSPHKAYLDALLTSVNAVDSARRSLLPKALHAEIRNDLLLTVSSPAWVFGRANLGSSRSLDPQRRRLLSLWHQIRRQDSYTSELTVEGDLDERDKAAVAGMINYRRKEMLTYVAGLCALSSLDLTPVVRIPPRINRIRGDLIQLGACARGGNPHRQFKVGKLFGRLTQSMKDNFDSRLFEKLEARAVGDGIKIVSDLPLELMPVDGLPLSMRFDCSRVPVTPGNLSLLNMLTARQVVLAVHDFQDILVIRSFAEDDPCQFLLEKAIRHIQERLDPKWVVRFQDVHNEQELLESLNNYNGPLVIFDCHGYRSDEDHSGTIVIGGDQIHLGSYRNVARVPPIVLFSACDTLPLDGSHASSASGMLLLGASGVLASLLPLDARAAAVLIARLILRLCEFLPLAVRMRGGGVTWRAFLAGMLRMAHVSEVLRNLLRLGLITSDQLEDVHLKANIAINSGNSEWPALVTSEIQTIAGTAANGCLNRLTEALMQVQIGHPESILIVEKPPAQIVSEAEMRLANLAS